MTKWTNRTLAEGKCPLLFTFCVYLNALSKLNNGKQDVLRAPLCCLSHSLVFIRVVPCKRPKKKHIFDKLTMVFVTKPYQSCGKYTLKVIHKWDANISQRTDTLFCLCDARGSSYIHTHTHTHAHTSRTETTIRVTER